MATFSRGAVKLAVTAGAFPAALGLGALRSVHADGGEQDTSHAKKNIVRACNLPLYDHTENERVSPPSEPYPRNNVEEQIGVARKTIFDMVTTFVTQCETVAEKISIGVEHSRASLEFIQTNPGFPRVALIVVAGMGGIVLGYRGGVLRKIAYSSIAAGSTSALCYPKQAVELSHDAYEELQATWEEVGGKELLSKAWPFAPKATKEESPPATPSFSPPKAVPQMMSSSQVKQDEGQSNPSDKDMYSTRGS